MLILIHRGKSVQGEKSGGMVWRAWQGKEMFIEVIVSAKLEFSLHCTIRANKLILVCNRYLRYIRSVSSSRGTSKGRQPASAIVPAHDEPLGRPIDRYANNYFLPRQAAFYLWMTAAAEQVDCSAASRRHRTMDRQSLPHRLPARYPLICATTETRVRSL